MGRPEADLDPGLGPVQRFAFELRKLRQEAGGITYRQMARQVEVSVSTLSRAANGEQLPSLQVALAYVRACGGDAEAWERRWREAVTEQARAADLVADDTVPSPYRGLARFDVGDAELFFGRDEMTDALVRAVAGHRVFAVFGPSGSGKSSLLRAGLIPRLRSLDGPHRPAAVRILTPGEHPLRTHDTVWAPAPGEGDTWLVVDQFEEVFTLCRDTGERAGFLARLLGAAEPASRLRVVLGVRADFYGRCAEHRELADALREANLLVGPMSPAELREAVVRPAQSAGLIVERELTARLVEEAGGEPGGLPLLSHALHETWRRRRGRALTMEAYEAAGGVHGAITQTAEEVYTRLSAGHAELARMILLRLIAPGEGSPDTRRPVDRSELDIGTAPQEDISLVLDQLARARLLTLDEDTVDLAHEALISAWPRLHGWIDENRRRLLLHRRLTQDALAWEVLDRDPGALYRGVRLAEAEGEFGGLGTGDLAFDDSDDLTSCERAFLVASRAARRRERRRWRVLRAVAGVTAVGLVVAMAVAWQRDDEADRRREEAAARRVAALAGSLRASDPVLAMRLSAAARQVSDTTETRAALLEAVTQPEVDVLTLPITDEDQQALLSADGSTLVMAGPQAVRAWDVVYRRQRELAGGGVDSSEGWADLSPDGQRMLVSGTGGETYLRDVDDVASDRGAGRVGREPFPGDFWQPVFGPSGRTALSFSGARPGEGAGVRLWDLATRRVLFSAPGALKAGVVVTGERVVTGEDSSDSGDYTVSRDMAAVSADDQLVALCTDSGSLQLWKVREKRQVKARWVANASAVVCSSRYRPRFVPGSNRLVALTGGGARMWDTESGKELPRLRHDDPSDLVFSADGAYAAAHSDAGIQVWRLGDENRPVFRFALGQERAFDLRIDGAQGVIRYLASNGGGNPRVRTVAFDTVTTTSQWRRSSADHARFSPDGTLLARVNAARGVARFELRGTGSGTRRELPSEPCPSGYEDTCLLLLAFAADGRTLAYGTSVQDAPADESPESMLPGSLDSSDTGGSDGSAESFDTASPVTVWDVGRARRAASLDVGVPSDASATDGIVLSTDANSLLVHRSDGTGWDQWDVRDGKRERRMAYPTDSATLESSQVEAFTLAGSGLAGRSVALRPDGRLMATVTGRITRLPTGRTANRLLSVDPVAVLQFSPAGDRLAAGDMTGWVHLWDGAVEHRLANFAGAQQDALMVLPQDAEASGYADSVTALAFSPDGRTLAVGGADGTVRLWDTASTQPLGFPLPTSGDPILDLAFSRDGTTLLATGANVALRTYPVGADRATAAVCRRADGGLTREQWRLYLPEIPYQRMC